MYFSQKFDVEIIYGIILQTLFTELQPNYLRFNWIDQGLSFVSSGVVCDKCLPKGRLHLFTHAQPPSSRFQLACTFQWFSKRNAFATELAMESIASSRLSPKVPNYLCNIMQIWSFLVSWFCDRPKEGREEINYFSCLPAS